MPVQSCQCGNKRVVLNITKGFQCENCIYKQKHPLIVEKPIKKVVEKKYIPSTIKITKEPFSYSNYLKSDHWQETKKRAILVRGACCECCESKERLHVHHVDYSNLGYEEMGDLRILCEGCHYALHELYKKHKAKRGRFQSLRKFSNRFINKKYNKLRKKRKDKIKIIRMFKEMDEQSYLKGILG